jgi:phosphoribosylformylglycinamidine synthase
VEIRERGLQALFGEAPSRILFTVGKGHLLEATRLLEGAGLPYRILGETGGKTLTVLTPEGVVEWGVDELLSAWKAPLREVLDG